MFDQIMILADGSTVYCGTFDGSINFFETNGFPCPRFENPADFYLDIVNTKDEFRTISEQEVAVDVDDEMRGVPSMEDKDDTSLNTSPHKFNQGLSRKEIVSKLVRFFFSRQLKNVLFPGFSFCSNQRKF
jgi:hypothetical protein